METSLKHAHLKPRINKFIVGCFMVIHLLYGCSPPSRKGEWSATDKENARKELQKVEVQLDHLGRKKAPFISCYLEKLEAHYSNLDEANQDEAGCTKLATLCLKNLQK